MEDKTIILSSLNSTNEKAVLNLEKCEEGYCGNIRLYNFKTIPSGILTLGFLAQNEVFKAALSEKKPNLYNFELKTKVPFSNFTCALVNIKGGNAKPILCGSSENVNNFDTALAKNFYFLDETSPSAEKVENALDESEIFYHEEEQKEIEKAINLNFADKCANCNYRKAFYSAPQSCQCNEKAEQISFSSYPEVEKSPTPTSAFSNVENFYDEIKGQLSLLFERYPEETFLNEIIPNSKWVKVDYEDNGQYFVIGLLYENNKVEYVCYGMPGEYTTTPPREFGSLCQWLPLDPEKPNELGYWLMYQDAETGENVEIKIS